MPSSISYWASSRIKIQVLWLLLVVFACQQQPQILRIHTEMGVMSIRIDQKIPEVKKALLSIPSDSLFVSKIFQDEFIQLQSKANLFADEPSSTDLHPVCGAVVQCDNDLIIVQGRKQTDQTLDSWEQKNGKKLASQARTQYKLKGGALNLEGSCSVLGVLLEGKEVLNRLAAIPCNAQGQPLRKIAFWVETN